MMSYFCGSKDELYYGDVRVEYVAYQDDIGKPSAGVQEAQPANIKMSHLFKEKGLTAHPDNSYYSEELKNRIRKHSVERYWI